MKSLAKEVVISSFKELLNTKSLDKITVKEICQHSKVNRQTFYNHFADIMDIYKFIFFLELSKEIAQNRTIDTWSGGFLATMNYIKRNSKMFLNVYNSTYRQEATTFFNSLSSHLLEDVLEECIVNMNVKIKESDQKFIVNFFRHVFNGLMLDWVIDGMKEEPEVILKKLLIMITGSIPRSVSAFVK